MCTGISEKPAAFISITVVQDAVDSSKLSVHRLHNDTSQRAVIFTVSAKVTSNLTSLLVVCIRKQMTGVSDFLNQLVKV
jgi:hypothetical protein